MGIKLEKEEQGRQASVDVSWLWKWPLFLLKLVWNIIWFPIRMIGKCFAFIWKHCPEFIGAFFEALFEIGGAILEAIFSGF